jgi:TP901 family phage tail tape measure protein
MNEVYKLMMDAGAFLQPAEKVTNALGGINKIFSEVEATTQSYNKKGVLVGQTFKGIAKNGEDLSVSLKAVANGFRLTNASMSNSVEKAKQFATIANNLTDSIEKGVNKALYNTANLQEKLNYKNAIASLNEYVRANEIAADKIALVKRNLDSGNPGAYKNPVLQGLQGKLVSVNKAQGGLGAQATAQANAAAAAAAQQAAQAQAALNQQVVNGTNAAQGYLLSWKSIIRFFEARILSNVISDINNAFKQGQADAIEYEKVVGRILTLAQGSGQGFKEWSDSVKNLSNQFGTDAKDTAEAYYSALSNQIGTTVGDIESYTRVTQQFALVTGSTAEQANNLFSSAINSFKLSAGDASTLAAKFFKVIDLGRIRASDLADTFGRTAVPAKVLGVSFDELAAGLTVLTRNGNTASDAQTQLLNLFNKFIKPTEELQKLLEKNGFATGQAAISALGFKGAMALLDEELRTGGLKQLGKEINDIRGFRGAIGLLGDSTKDYTADLEKIPAAQAQYDAAIQSSIQVTGQKLSIELNRAKNVFLEIGQSANEVAVKMLSLFGDNNNGLANVIKSLVELMASLAGGAAIGGVIYGFTKLIQIAANLRTVMLGLNAVMLANPYILLAAGAAAVGAAFIDMAYNTKTAAQIYHSAFEDMQNAQADNLNKFNQAVTAYAEKIKDKQNTIYKALEGNAANLTATSGETLKQMQSLYTDFADKLSLANQALESSISEGITKSKSTIEGYNTEIQKAQKNILNLQRSFNTDKFNSGLEGKTDGQKIKALIGESNRVANLASGAAAVGDTELARSQIKESVDLMKEAIKLQKEMDKRIKELKAENIEGKIDALDRKGALAKFREQVALRSKKATTRTGGAMVYADAEATSADAYDALISKQAELNKLQSDNPHLDILKLTNAEQLKQISLEQQIIDLTTQRKAAEEEELAKKKAAFLQVKELDKQLADINRVQAGNPIFDKGSKLFGDRGVNPEDVLKEYDRIGAARDAAAQAAGVSNEYLLTLNRDLINRRTTLALEVTAFAQKAAADQLAKDISEQANNVGKNIDELKAKQQKSGQAIVEGRSRIAGFGATIGTRFGGAGADEGVNLQDLKARLANVPNDITALTKLKSDLQIAMSRMFDNASNLGISADKGTPIGDTITGLQNSLIAVADQISNLNTSQSLAGAMNAAETSGSAAIDSLINKIAQLQNQISATAAQANMLFNATQGQAVAPNPLTKAAGGMIHGSDTIPALLARGEYVMNARASRSFASQLNSMNTGMIKFNTGGSTSNTTVGDIHINAASGTDVRALGQALRKEIKRGTVRLK